MLKQLKLKVLVTIALLGCSTNLLANDVDNFPTGEVVEQTDSVMIAYDDLRIVNSKLVELDYEKQINANLRQVVANDSIIINDYNATNTRLNQDCKKYIRQRNIAIGGGIFITILGTILLLVK